MFLYFEFYRRENYLELDVFYRELNYEEIQQQVAYDLFGLLCKLLYPFFNPPPLLCY